MKRIQSTICIIMSLLLLSASLFSMSVRADEENTGNAETGDSAQTTQSTSTETEEIYETTGTSGFVYRLYTLTLNRTPDREGFNNWVELLSDYSCTGAHVALGFFHSNEFLKKELTNEEFITILYSVFFDRAPDAEGFDNWCRLLNNNEITRDEALTGFIDSNEWATICILFGIISGGKGTVPTDCIPENIRNFVTRLYSLCLNREPDEEGFRNWCNKLATREESGKQVAYGFFFSDEFKAKATNLELEELVEIYYHVFLNRDSDPDGLADWIGMLGQRDENVVSFKGIDELFDGFADSVEFANICTNYRILVGDHIATPDVPRWVADYIDIPYTDYHTLMDYYLSNNLISTSRISEVQDSLVEQSEYWLRLREETGYPNYGFGGKILVPSAGVDCSGYITIMYRRALGTMLPVTSGISDYVNNSANYIQSMTNYGRANMGGRFYSVYPYRREGVHRSPDGRTFYVDKYGIASPIIMNTYQWLYYLNALDVDYTRVEMKDLVVSEDWAFLDEYQAGDVILWWDGKTEAYTDSDSWHMGIYDGFGGVYHSSSVDTSNFQHNNVGVQRSNIADMLMSTRNERTMVIFHCF